MIKSVIVFIELIVNNYSRLIWAHSPQRAVWEGHPRCAPDYFKRRLFAFSPLCRWCISIPVAHLRWKPRQ